MTPRLGTRPCDVAAWVPAMASVGATFRRGKWRLSPAEEHADAERPCADPDCREAHPVRECARYHEGGGE
jgi:hypothetical protein